jgi:hypothetical protein
MSGEQGLGTGTTTPVPHVRTCQLKAWALFDRAIGAQVEQMTKIGGVWQTCALCT